MNKTKDIKKGQTALFIGRFQPFHLGHLDAIRQILAVNKRVIIGIGSAQYKDMPKNPFPSDLRKKMIERSLLGAKIPKGKFSIIKISDINDDEKWVAYVEGCVPTFDQVWSGTPKVRKLFKLCGRYPVIKPKFNVDVSGTRVRTLMSKKKKWEPLVPSPVPPLIKLTNGQSPK